MLIMIQDRSNWSIQQGNELYCEKIKNRLFELTILKKVFDLAFENDAI